uniref:Uncharacterized protein n=1 Tax=Anguilla anguilla TaxID=7936 RepID=A0A0E9SQ00_ANGAN
MIFLQLAKLPSVSAFITEDKCGHWFISASSLNLGVCTVLFLHFPHVNRSVSVPPVRAIWCSRMASLVRFLRISLSSSLAISCAEEKRRERD